MAYDENKIDSIIEAQAHSILSEDNSIISNSFQSFPRTFCQRSSTKMACNFPLQFYLPPISTFKYPPKNLDPSVIKNTKLFLKVVINFTDQSRTDIESRELSLKFENEEEEFPPNEYSYQKKFY